MQEVWKDIKGFEEVYQISNFGRVRSKDRRAVNHRSGATRIVRGMILTPWDNGNGYLVVSLNNKRKRKNRYVHRLVAEAFIENPEKKRFINHLDYNKHNNCVTNIEWCTQAENVAYSVEHMKKPRARCKPTNTGEKYISQRTGRNGESYYRVSITNQRIKVCKQFKTLEEAVMYRNEVMQKWQNL